MSNIIAIMAQILSSAFFAALFLIPGMLLSFAFFRQSRASSLGLLKRLVFGICFSASLFAIVNAANHIVGISTLVGGIAEYACIVAGLWLIYARVARKDKVGGDRSFGWADGASDVVRVALVAALGTAWKLLFVLPIKNIGSAYDYASKFAKGTVPDLGFYTGMASDHANYAFASADGFWMRMQAAMTNPSFDISLFLITFAFLGFVYTLCLEYFSDRRHALFATAIMALGPFEIFYTSSSIFGHPMAYLAIFSLFFLFKSAATDSDDAHGTIERRGSFWLAASLCLAMGITYYTSTMANIIVCAGFCIAIFLEKWIRNRDRTLAAKLKSTFRDGRLRSFILIAAMSAGAFFVISSDMLVFTNDLIRDTTAIKSTAALNAQSTTTVFVGSETLRPYRDPAIFGISAIRAQAIVFISFGLAFLVLFILRMRNMRGKSDSDTYPKELSAALAIVPAALASFAFIYAGYPARAFDYFGFFALLLLALSFSVRTDGKMPSSRFTYAWISILAITALLSLQTMRDKRVYFERSDGEVAGALWIAEHLDGKILSDQSFISQIISNGYYDVTGTSDTDPRLSALFYQNDPNILLSAATTSLDIDYIATTKRMRESHILMLDIPQIPVQNSSVIDATLEKVYDNGDVRIYSTERKSDAPLKRK